MTPDTILPNHYTISQKFHKSGHDFPNTQRTRMQAADPNWWLEQKLVPFRLAVHMKSLRKVLRYLETHLEDWAGEINWECKYFKQKLPHSVIINIQKHSPGWCGSVDWAPACERKGCWLDSQGTCPGGGPDARLGVCEATHPCISSILMFLSLSFSLPSPLWINKTFNRLVSNTVRILHRIVYIL